MTRCSQGPHQQLLVRIGEGPSNFFRSGDVVRQDEYTQIVQPRTEAFLTEERLEREKLARKKTDFEAQVALVKLMKREEAELRVLVSTKYTVSIATRPVGILLKRPYFLVECHWRLRS